MDSTVEATPEVPTTPPADDGQTSENRVQDNSHNGNVVQNLDISADEMRSMLELTASTGKFWNDWGFLKRVLSSQLKQVSEEYSETQPVDGAAPQQSSISGESRAEILRRLDQAILSFEDGPPFTLQRISEILLYPKSTYTKFSKFAFALEKNLLVSSTLVKCSEKCTRPGTVNRRTDTAAEQVAQPLEAPPPVSNGVENAEGDGDEEMTDAESYDDGTQDTEMQEAKPNQAEAGAEVAGPPTGSIPSGLTEAIAGSDQSPVSGS